MLRHTRHQLSVFTLFVSACFNPEAENTTGEDPTGSSSGTTSLTPGSSDNESTSTEQGDTGNGTEPPTGSSGSSDEPPSISTFTVDGSKTPPEAMVGGYVTLDVDATDDFGLNRVEFYDNGMLLATVSRSPYTSEVLLSSADNGPHNLWARAVDTAGQEGLSDEIHFSVNIIGGELLETRDFGTVQVLLDHAPTISTEGTALHVMARSQDPSDPEIGGVSYWGYNLQLSLTQHIQSGADAGALEVISHSPAIRTSSGDLLVGGAASTGGDLYTSAFYINNAASSISRVDLTLTDDFVPMAVDVNEKGRAIATIEASTIGSYASDFSETDWTNELGPDGEVSLHRVIVDGDNNTTVTYQSPDCAAGASDCIRRIRPDGSTAWTRPLAASSFASSIDADGQIAVGTLPGESETAIYVFDSRGNSNMLWIANTDHARILDLSYDQQGNIIAVGSSSSGLLGDATAWAIRLSDDGSVIWERTYDEVGSNSLLTSVTIDANGRAFAVGVHDLFDGDIISFSAEGFVAELAL